MSLLKRKLSGLTKPPRSVHVWILYIHSDDGGYNIMRKRHTNMVREGGIPCSVEQKCHRFCSSSTEMPAFSINLFARCELLQPWVTAVFCREADDNCALLGHYAASSGNFLPMFRDNFSVPSSGVKMMVPIGCPETDKKLPLLSA